MPHSKPTICGVCGHNSSLDWKEDHNEYSLWKCSKCAGQFWTPMKNPGAAWYEEDERYSFRNLNPLKKPEWKHYLFLRDLPLRAGKILDIGMGTGNFLAAAIAAGYDGYGIDFDRDAIAAAQKTFGLKNVYVSDIDGALERFGPGTFDAVTLFEVLEHVENPPIFIGKIRKLLKPGGYLGISVPYRGTPKFLQPHDLPPRHLSRWNEKAMANFLSANGFKAVKVQKLHLPFGYLITKFHFWTKGFLSFGLVQKASARRGDSSSVRTLQKSARVKDYVLFSIPAALFYFALWLFGRNHLGLYALTQLG